MKYFYLITILTFTISCSQIQKSNRAPNSFSQSEIQAIKNRLKKFDYSYPEKFIDQISQIKKELTPELTDKASEVISRKKTLRCIKEEIKIYYKDNNKLQSFVAIFKKPRQYIGKKKLYPVIVIQPTLAGPSVLENNIARDICHNGMASIVPTETILKQPDVLPDFEYYDRNMRIEMIRAQRMIDYTQTRADIELTKIGVIGFSRGAIAGSLLIGIDSRIDFGYLGAGGVGFAEIIARSKTEKGIEENIKHMTSANMNPEEYESSLRNHLKYDGILFSHLVDPHKLKLMIVPNDKLVSTKHQELLKKAFNNPEFTLRNKGHVGSILRQVFLYKKEYIDFFIDRTK